MAVGGTSTIYGLEATDDPGNVRYVGMTTEHYLCSRVGVHRYDAIRKRRKSLVCRWTREVLARGADITGVVLEKDAAEDAEEKWIGLLREQPGGLLNTRSGGKHGGRFDEDGRSRISEALKLSYSTSNRALKVSGEANAMSRLTNEQVWTVRSDHAKGAGSYTVLAARFGVSKSTVGLVVTRRVWAHI